MITHFLILVNNLLTTSSPYSHNTDSTDTKTNYTFTNILSLPLSLSHPPSNNTTHSLPQLQQCDHYRWTLHQEYGAPKTNID